MKYVLELVHLCLDYERIYEYYVSNGYSMCNCALNNRKNNESNDYAGMIIRIKYNMGRKELALNESSKENYTQREIGKYEIARKD